MKVGITGHQKLENPSKIESAIEESIKSIKKPVIGLTSLAKGADQIFGKAVLNNSGSLWVILPFKNYDAVFVDTSDCDGYFQLLKKAEKVETLEMTGSKEKSYFAAGKRIVDLADIMIAVWNGKKAAGLGGTGDIVAYAEQIDKKVIYINPE
jgi:hypothetical protein